MRKIQEYLAKNNLKDGNILSFPYDKLVTTPWNTRVFRLCVDAFNGNDAYDGLSWEKPKKSIQAAINELPFDMQFYEAYVFVHSGDYDPFYINKNNGTVFLYWVADFMNAKTYNEHILAVGNSINPFRDKNPINVILKESNSRDGLAFDSWGNNLNVYILSKNEGIPSPWSSEYIYADRWVFKTDGICVKNALFSVNNFLFILNARLELGKCTDAGIWFRGANSSGEIISLALIGGTGNASTQSGDWKGAIWFFGTDKSLVIGNTTLGFAFAYNNHGVYFYFDGVKQFWNNPSATGKNVNINPLSVGSINDVGGTKPAIKLASNFSGTCQYDPDYIVLTDSSTYPRTIVDKKNSITNNYLDSIIKKQSDYLLFVAKSSAPADSVLSNKDLSFYVDETNHKLKFKLKYAAGTVKNGEISLT